MLTQIELHGYRGFSHYALPHLSRVNLLVGKNSCGKTSLLEGIRLLASGGDPRVLIQVARRRGEVAPADEEAERYRGATYPVLSHFFHGHAFGEGATLSIAANEGSYGLQVVVGSPDKSEDQRELFDEQTQLRRMLSVRIRGGSHPLSHRGLPVTEDGVLGLGQRDYRYLPSTGRDSDRGSSVEFIAPDVLEPNSMSDMWNRVIIEGREHEVTEALRILEPGVTDVVFLSGQLPSAYEAHTGVLVSIRGARRRVPLGSLGDGMRRLLALALGLVQAERGVLLVDEIDTGLHYSVMGDMWRLLIEAAVRSDVQVFATTHSYDCVHGLAWLCENYRHLAGDVSVQKIDGNLFEAVSVEHARLALAVEKGLELR